MKSDCIATAVFCREVCEHCKNTCANYDFRFMALYVRLNVVLFACVIAVPGLLNYPFNALH